MLAIKKGFSLIELMIVISIIGILTLVGIPSYQYYLQRARFADVIAAVQPFKTAVTLALQMGIPPEQLINGAHGIPEAMTYSKNIASINVNHGLITATASNLINHHTYLLKPTLDGSQWTVGGSCVKNNLCTA